jgi:HEAT repeat protein
MDRQEKRAQKRVRKIAASGDGRALLDALLDGDGNAVESVLNEMGASGVSLLTSALAAATSDDEVWFALMKLGHTQSAAALVPIQGAMKHESPSVRALAVRQLAQSGTAAHAEAIMQALSDPSPDVRDAAVEVLGDMIQRYGAEQLPSELGDLLAAAHEQDATRERDAREAALAAPLTQRSAAVLLLGLCDHIDRTYVEPVALDADERRAELRADVVDIGRRLFDQGGEPLMLEVAVLVRSASSHGGFVSREWSGIGSWMG